MTEHLEKRLRFTVLIAKLILWASQNGYQLAFGEAKRSDEQAEINAMGTAGRRSLVAFIERMFPLLASKIANNTGNGIRNSLHELGLAVDFDLYIDGKWQSRTEDHKAIGEYWESLDPECCWGGRFGDGNHYSLTFGGRK